MIIKSSSRVAATTAKNVSPSTSVPTTPIAIRHESHAEHDTASMPDQRQPSFDVQTGHRNFVNTIDLTDFEDTGDVVIRAGLGLLRDGKIILESADREPILELDFTTGVVIHGNLTVTGSIVSSSPIAVQHQQQLEPEQWAPLKPQPVDSMEPTQRSSPTGSIESRPIALRRIDVCSLGGSINVKLTPGIGVLECIAVDSDTYDDAIVGDGGDDTENGYDSSLTAVCVMAIEIEWDSSLLSPPFVMSQFIGPSSMEFRILEVTEDGMRCELVSLDPNEPIKSCKVHYHIQDTS